MKRLIALLLVSLFVLTACGDASSVTTVIEHDGSVEALIAEPNTDLKETDVVVSLGANYTAMIEDAENYPDTYHQELTNGKTDKEITTYTDDSLVGYSARIQNITIDLGEVKDNIHTVSAAYFVYDGAGISTALTIEVFSSMDGKSWDSIGVLQDETAVKVGAINDASLKFEEKFSARYFKFKITGNKTWIFLEELSVIAFTMPDPQISYPHEVYNTYKELGTTAPVKEGKEIDYSLIKVDVAERATYKLSKEPLQKFADKGNMLTDGIESGSISAENWVGFKGGDDITVTLNLGKNASDIASIELKSVLNPSTDVYLPAAVSVVAYNGDKKTDLGVYYGNLYAKQGGYAFVIPFEKAITATKLDITLHTIDNTICLIEEINVYAYCEKDTSLLYPQVVIDENNTPWENPTDDYVNLVLKKPCQIDVTVNPEAVYHENNSKVTEKMLTDGAFSSDHNIHNGRFFKFYLGDRRNLIFDLEHVSAVDKFSIGFCDVQDWAVFAPEVVSVIISADGENWYKVADVTPTESNIPAMKKVELTLNEKIKARYVAFAFDVFSWVGIDEVQIFGTQTTANAVDYTENPVYEDTTETHRIPPSEDLLGGAKDLCLLYHAEDFNGYRKNDLIPYLAYVDENGVPQDVMFDSFLFLHNTGSMPSGATAAQGSVKSDWEWCINDLFRNGRNLYALDKAAGEVKEALGLGDDYKYKVTMTVYYPTTDVVDFGDVDGDGKSENMSVYDDRIKALKWYIETVERAFERANFSNIELVGYYWWHEAIEATDKDGEKMLNAISDMCHEKGKDFFWIPWFCAPGFKNWADYGFDVACMQPNYVFSSEKPYGNLKNCAQYTERYGMGVEMEIWEGCLSDEVYFKRYMEYIAAGAQYGYMNDTVCMYYQSYFVFRDAAYSTSSMARMIYDATYHFIKGDLDAIPEPLGDFSCTTEKNKLFAGSIPLAKDKLTDVKITSMPEHGTVTVDSNGNFCYYPEKDFTGTVTFSFVYTECFLWSEESVVTITIE